MAPVSTEAQPTPAPAVLTKTGFSLPTYGRLKKIMSNFHTPYGHVTATQKKFITGTWVAILAIAWYFNSIPFFPSFTEVIERISYMYDKEGLVAELWSSLQLCIVSLILGTFISAIITYLSPIAVMRPATLFSTKLRYLPLAGLTFFFTLLSSSGSLKVYLLVFSMSVFFTTSFIGAIAMKEEDYIRARTLGLSKWQTLWYNVITGKRAVLIDIMANTFAILWMSLPSVELLVRSSGGIGVLLSVEAKYFKLAGIVAIAIIITIIGIAFDALFGLIKVMIAPHTKYEAK